MKSGDTWQVVSEPEYTSRGITFEALPVSDDEVSRIVTAKPHERFELISYQPAPPPAIEPMKASCFVCVHQGQLIGILSDGAAYAYSVFSPGASFEQSGTHYLDAEAALNAAIDRIEEESCWRAGFQSYERGEPFPEIADADFARGWRDGLGAYGGVESLSAA